MNVSRLIWGIVCLAVAGLLGKPLRTPFALTAAILGGLCALVGKLAGSDLLVAGSFAFGAAVFAADRIVILIRRGKS